MFSQFIEALFPSRCIICHREGFFICPKHTQETATNLPTYKDIDRVYAAFNYKTEATQQIIQNLKYYGKHAIAKEMAAQIKYQVSIPKDAILVPVPLHWQRWLWRGCNQARKLADAIANTNGNSVQTLLKRVKNTPQQAKLERMARLRNVKTAFATRNMKMPQYVILVDDVAATGATLSACAHALKKAGVERVDALVYAISKPTSVNKRKKA